MALAGKAVLMNWSNVAPEHRSEYYEWHNREHIAGRLELPGFRRGRRFFALEADRDIFNLYEVDDLGVLTGPEYTALAARPSPTYQHIGKLITDAIRALAHVRYTDGVIQGGLVATLRFGAEEEEAAERRLTEEIMPRLGESAEIVGAHLCVADRTASSVVTADRTGRPTQVPEWAIIVEGTTLEALRLARADHLAEERLIQLGCRGPFAFGLYQLQVAMSR